MIVAGDIEKVFKEDDIRKRAEDEQKVKKRCKSKCNIFSIKAKLANAKGSGRFG